MNRNHFLFSCCVGLLLLLSGCWGKKETLYVVNVLDEALYAECHIAGSINVPYGQVKDWAEGIDKDTEIVFYCSNYACTGSGFAAKHLLDMGFTHVWAYEAGMHGWHTKGYPEVCVTETAYLQQPNPEPSEEPSVPTLTTDQLYQKMMEHGLLAQ